MKKLAACLILVLATAYAGAQSTTASSTGVVDTDGFTWAGGTVTVSFVPSAQHPSFSSYSWTGGTLLPAFATGLSSTGTFSISLPSNTAISPTGSQWAFQLCPNATKGCFSFTTALTGATQNLTASINALAVGPRFPGNTSTPLFGYGPIEINTAVSTATVFFNTTTSACQIFNGTSFVACASGGSGTGSVTMVSSSNLSPLFNVNVSNPTTTPAFTFASIAQTANSVYGNFTSGSAVPTFSTAPVFSAANLTNFPTFNQPTTGNAATATTAANFTATTNATLVTASALTTANGGAFGTAAFQPSSAFVAAGDAVSSINSTAGAFTFSFASGAGSCSGTTCNFTGSSSGGTGTVTSFSAGGLSPLFTTGVSNATTTPLLNFAQSTSASHSVFGNFTSSGAVPTFSTAPVFSAASLTNFPTFNQSTNGSAASLSAASALPSGTTATTQTTGDNTTDVSTDAFVNASITAGAFAPLASPAFTGTPTAPTQTVGDNTTAIATDAFVLANSSSGGLPSGCSSPGTGSITCTGTITDAGEVVNGTFALNSTSTAPMTVFNSALANGGNVEMMIGQAPTSLNGTSILYQKVSTGSLSNTAVWAINSQPGVTLSVTGGLTAPTTRRGTFTCTAGGTITVAATKVIVGSDIVITLETAGGVITTVPAINSLTAGTGFNVLCGATDTSVYRFSVLN